MLGATHRITASTSHTTPTTQATTVQFSAFGGRPRKRPRALGRSCMLCLSSNSRLGVSDLRPFSCKAKVRFHHILFVYFFADKSSSYAGRRSRLARMRLSPTFGLESSRL